MKQVPRVIQDLVLNKVSKGEGLWFCLFDKESFWQTVKPRSLCGCGPNVSNFQTLSIQFPQKKRRGRKVTKMPQNFTSTAKYIVTRKKTAFLHLSLSLSPPALLRVVWIFSGQSRVSGIEKLIYLLVLWFLPILNAAFSLSAIDYLKQTAIPTNTTVPA